MRIYNFSKKALYDIKELSKQHSNISQRIERLVLEICEKGYDLPQTGKPEPLKGDLSGWWSKRVTKVDRMVYRIKITEINGKEIEVVEIASCKYHY